MFDKILQKITYFKVISIPLLRDLNLLMKSSIFHVLHAETLHFENKMNRKTNLVWKIAVPYEREMQSSFEMEWNAADAEVEPSQRSYAFDAESMMCLQIGRPRCHCR